MSRLIQILLLSLAAAGCGGGEDPAERRPEIEDAERQLGAEQHPKLLAEFGGSYDASEAKYVARLGEKIAGAAGLEGQCTFTLVNSEVVNAFAVPGCYIYITRGLMGIVNSEAELASVLAHEVGHIVGDHSERQQKRSILRTLGVMAVGLLTGSERLTQIAGQAAQYFTLRYSRGQEYQSDELGIRYMKEAGYDPHAAAEMLDALGRQEQYLARTSGRDEAQGIPEWARTHPLTENRIERARQIAAQTGAKPGALAENEEAYLREVDGLLYGDDPAQGFVRGRRFDHPVMRIGFEAPEGFTLTNSPAAIMISSTGGVKGEFGGAEIPSGGLAAYTEALMAQTLQGATAEVGESVTTRINGVPAIITPARVRTQQGTAEISFAVYAGQDGGGYHFIMVSPPGEAAAAAVARLFASFRLLSEEQARSLRPRVIRVVAARAQDSLQTMARLMASEFPLEHFLMLNDRSAGEPLKAGERVKIVSFAGS
jgi:predicted Zn-dependent protease